MPEFFLLPIADHGAVLESYAGDPFGDDGPELLDAFIMHATLSESHSRSTKYTRHPVERGADISDHATDDPDTITLSGILTRTPLGPLAETAPPDEVDRALDLLEAFRRERRPVNLTSAGRVYGALNLDGGGEYYLTSLKYSRGVDDGQRWQVELTLESIAVVEARRVEVPASVIEQERRPSGTPETDGGTQSPQQQSVEEQAAASTTETSQEDDDRSVMARGWDAIESENGGFPNPASMFPDLGL